MGSKGSVGGGQGGQSGVRGEGRVYPTHHYPMAAWDMSCREPNPHIHHQHSNSNSNVCEFVEMVRACACAVGRERYSCGKKWWSELPHIMEQ